MPFVGPIANDESRWTQIWTVDLRQLREIRPRSFEFEVLREFGYTTRPPGAGSVPQWPAPHIDYLIPRGTRTDLATVPSFLWGVVASYGRQTLPAILHDIQCEEHQREDLSAPYRRRARREADVLFRSTLAVAGAGPVRRWLMWTGVRLGGLKPLAGGLIAAGILLLVALVAAIGWSGPAWAGWTAIAAVVVLLGSVIVSSVESRIVGLDDGVRVPPGSVPPQGAAEFSPAGFSLGACRSVLSTVLLAVAALVPMLIVTVVTVSTAWVMRRGERELPASVGADGNSAHRDAGPVARIEWTPRSAGDSTVNGDPGLDGF